MRVPTVMLAALLLTNVALSAQSAADEDAIKGLAARWESAWNKHDMNLLGTLMTEDIDFVNRAAVHWTGRAQVVKEHADRHRARFKNSVWGTEAVQIQFVRPDVALVHLRWTTTGDLDFDMKSWGQRKGLFTWVVVKTNGAWKIRAVQNTDLDPRAVS